VCFTSRDGCGHYRSEDSAWLPTGFEDFDHSWWWSLPKLAVIRRQSCFHQLKAGDFRWAGPNYPLSPNLEFQSFGWMVEWVRWPSRRGAVSGIVLRMRSCVLFWTRDSSTKVIRDVSQEGNSQTTRTTSSSVHWPSLNEQPHLANIPEEIVPILPFHPIQQKNWWFPQKIDSHSCFKS